MIAAVHVAGPVQLGGLFQACARCGHVLQDYTGSQPMVPEGSDTTLPAWPEGERVGTVGNATYLVNSDRSLDGDEIECRPAS